MKYMIAWRISPAHHRAAADAFLSGGAPVPEPLRILGRWHAPGSSRGWALIEGDDPVALAEHVGTWANMLETDITPVVDDEGAAQALSRIQRT